MPSTRPASSLLLLSGAMLSGILLGVGTPGYPTQLLGLLAIPGLLIVLEQLPQNLSKGQQARYSFGLCWLTGGIGALIAAHWITNSVHVFGNLPFPVALAITGVGYGLEVGVLLWVAFAAPRLLFPDQSSRDVPLRLLWAVGADAFWPRLIHWNLGALPLSGIPLLEQSAALLGSSGMGLFSFGFAFVLLQAWRLRNDLISRAVLQRVLWGVTLLWGAGFGYGVWTLQGGPPKQPPSRALQVVAIQPNFSLQALASNPELAYSDREANLRALLEDSRMGLTRTSSDAPRLLVWPESVFPGAFFQDATLRGEVRAFLQEHPTHLLLTSVDWEREGDRWKFYGISTLLNPEGQELGRYRKIFLIPFGETIPLSSWFPKWAAWLREQIPNMSEFVAGEEFTTFPITEGWVSAPICFDVFAPQTIREMVRNGAQLVVNPSNLAWFGKSTASDNMEAVLRWRAIENRVPVLFASNNGRTVFLGADGQPQSERLELFMPGVLVHQLVLESRSSFSRDFPEALAGVWGIGLLLAFWSLRSGSKRSARRSR